MSEETTAFHEAGHAVAMQVLHRAIRKVSITPDDDSAGRVIMRSPLRPFSGREELVELQSPGVRNKRRAHLEFALQRHRARCRDMLTIVQAGPRAVAKRTGSDKPYKDDSDTAHLRFLLRELDVSTGEQLEHTFEEAVRHADQILDLFWEDVVAVAGELCRRKTLSGAALKRLILDNHAQRHRNE